MEGLTTKKTKYLINSTLNLHVYSNSEDIYYNSD